MAGYSQTVGVEIYPDITVTVMLDLIDVSLGGSASRLDTREAKAVRKALKRAIKTAEANA